MRVRIILGRWLGCLGIRGARQYLLRLRVSGDAAMFAEEVLEIVRKDELDWGRAERPKRAGSIALSLLGSKGLGSGVLVLRG